MVGLGKEGVVGREGEVEEAVDHWAWGWISFIVRFLWKKG